MSPDLSALARRFSVGSREFAGCPPYTELCEVISRDERLLEIAAACREGQQPTNLLLGAVHYLLLTDPSQPLARWYPSISDDPRSPTDVTDAFTDFCLGHHDELVELVSRRLVQTNEVKRSVALRLGLHAVAADGADSITLLEIGASAGLLLAFDRYGYRLGDRSGGASSPLVLDVDWRGADPPPDLDDLPVIRQRLGVDLNPIDPSDQRERQWLRALVWPGQEQRARQLTQALDLLAEDPPHVVRGDAIDVLASLDGQVDTTRPVVVFHAATIAHIPGDRRPDLQRAIDALGEQRPVYHLSLEGTREPIPELDGKPGHLLSLTTPRASDPRHLAAVDGHGEWIAPTRP